MMTEPATSPKQQGLAQGSEFSWKKQLPLALVVAGLGAFMALDLDHYLSFEALRAHRFLLLGLIDDHRVLAPMIFAIAYALAVALSLPSGAVLTIAAGFLFGAVPGTVYVVLSATIGAVAIFLIARSALGRPLRARAGAWLQNLEAGFRKNALSYLLVLRLIPLFPFFVVNLVPAFLGVGLPVYTVATLLGIIPGTVVFVGVGVGLGSIFDAGAGFTAEGLLTPEAVTALAGLAALSMLPVAYKAVRARRARTAP